MKSRSRQPLTGLAYLLSTPATTCSRPWISCCFRNALFARNPAVPGHCAVMSARSELHTSTLRGMQCSTSWVQVQERVAFSLRGRCSAELDCHSAYEQRAGLQAMESHHRVARRRPSTAHVDVLGPQAAEDARFKAVSCVPGGSRNLPRASSRSQHHCGIAEGNDVLATSFALSGGPGGVQLPATAYTDFSYDIRDQRLLHFFPVLF